MGDVVDADLFYRFDSTIVGIILLLMLLLRLIKTDILKMKYLAPLIMGLILIFFTSFLPIHVTTASRLVIGDGAYFILFGSALLIISSIINQLYSQ